MITLAEDNDERPEVTVARAANRRIRALEAENQRLRQKLIRLAIWLDTTDLFNDPNVGHIKEVLDAT